ncbi:MAG: chorismate synthase, partial [Candidatus Limnocylindrales bacterium]
EKAHYERSDISVVPAAGVVAEAMVCLILADFALEKFGGDSMAEMLDNASRFREKAARSPVAGGSAHGQAGSSTGETIPAESE